MRHAYFRRAHLAVLDFIDGYIRENVISPSYDEIAEAMDWRSKSRVCLVVDDLVAFGYLRRLPNRARALEVIRYPHELRPVGTPGNVRAAVDAAWPEKVRAAEPPASLVWGSNIRRADASTEALVLAFNMRPVAAPSRISSSRSET